MIQKNFDGKIQRIVFGLPSLQTRMCEESLETYKLYFGFKDCFLVNNYSIGIKVGISVLKIS